MRTRRGAALVAAFALTALAAAAVPAARAQTPPPPPPAPQPAASSASPLPPGSGAPSPTPPAQLQEPSNGATPPPIVVTPDNAQVAVGSSVRLAVGSVIGQITATAADPNIAQISVDQSGQAVTVFGKQPGSTTITIIDGRGLRRDVPVRVAYYAGSISPNISLSITGDPATSEFVREQVVGALKRAAQLQPGAQMVVGTDDVSFNGTLGQDRIATVNVPVLLQGTQYFEVDSTVHVSIRNVAAPRISPDSLMVSDYPERLEENGTLFTADLRGQQPSRFLYFHYNPPGQPDRVIVLHADNHSGEPLTLQFISGRGGPSSNEMAAGHAATRAFLVNALQNQGRLIEVPANSSMAIVTQDIPAGTIACNLLQLRVLSGGASVHLTLQAEPASGLASPSPDAGTLLEAAHKHARGIYPIPEFHYATQWNVNDEYLELPIGHIPLPNDLQGQALSGDYGVLQSFVVTLQNPNGSPASIAIYENPRGGRATATYLIDGVLVQSHQTPPYSRYKVRQYVVPARGFVRVTIVTMPEAGSSYPLKLIFAPDDGSVAPGAPGSPIY
ncbi:MAG TPA: pilus assembly protein N-terminal domain-containing protein [Candidatus Tumulicola sp.]